MLRIVIENWNVTWAEHLWSWAQLSTLWLLILLLWHFGILGLAPVSWVLATGSTILSQWVFMLNHRLKLNTNQHEQIQNLNKTNLETFNPNVRTTGQNYGHWSERQISTKVSDGVWFLWSPLILLNSVFHRKYVKYTRWNCKSGNILNLFFNLWKSTENFINHPINCSGPLGKLEFWVAASITWDWKEVLCFM